MPSGALYLESAVIPEAASQEVTWSISAGEELANVDPVGIVTAIQNGFVTVQATSIENSSIFDEIIVEITNQETTSIPQIYQKLFSLYPNPAQDYIRVHSEKPIKMVSILNILGQKVHITTESNIQLSGWSNGIYIMKIETIDNHSVQLKFEKI